MAPHEVVSRPDRARTLNLRQAGEVLLIDVDIEGVFGAET
jgi:hypothetical protein